MSAKKSFAIAFISALAGAAVGGCAIYFFDPVSGRRRRAFVGNKALRYRNDLRDYSLKQSRNAKNHLRGWFIKVAKTLEPRTIPDDAILEQKVRTAMGRQLRHARAVKVDVKNGEVRLNGPVLTDEVERLIERVRKVPGVIRVVNELEVHQAPENIPSLQGDGKPYLQH